MAATRTTAKKKRQPARARPAGAKARTAKISPLQAKLATVRRKLQDLEARGRIFVEALPDILVEIGCDGRLLYVNPMGVKVSGYKASQLIGRPVADLVRPEHRSAIARAMATKTPSTAATPADLRTRDGRYLPYEWMSMTLRDSAGKLTGFLATGRDLSKQRSQEKLLHASETRTRDFAEAASDWFWESGPDHRFIFISERIFELSGRGRDAFLGKRIWELDFLRFEGDDMARVSAAIRERKPFRDCHLRCRHADGRILRLLTAGKPNFDANGEFLGYRGAGTDITTAVSTRDALRLSEQRFKTIFEAEPSCIKVLSPEGKFLEINPAGVRILAAKDRGELIGRHFSQFVAAHYIKPLEERLAKVFAGQIETVQYEAIDCNGVAHWMETTLAPILGVGDQVTSALAVSREITLQKAVEEKMRQAQKMEAVGRLTGGVAHDFNNLLTVIIGNTELLLEDIDAESENRRLAESIMLAARAGAELTRLLLAYSRRQPLQVSEFCINDAVVGMSDLLHRTVSENVEIETRLSPDLWGVRTDRAQMESVLLNLTLNARDAMSQGGRLIIETRNVHIDEAQNYSNEEIGAGEYVMIAVSDTGSGIPPHLLDRVFEPFFTTKDVGKGSGLGLSMVYGFAKQSGGHVKIYSEEGLGTVVRIYLPRAEIQLNLPALEPEPAQWRARTGEKILVVEDDVQVRRYVTGQLDSLGYEVIEAENGRQALARLANLQSVDLLFTDVVMPGGIGGRQLAEEAQRIHPGLKVLLTSGYTEEAAIQNAKLGIAGPLLSKPYRKHELARRVRNILDNAL